MAKAFHNSLWIYATFCQHGTMCMSQTVGVEQVVTKFPVNDSGTVFERVRCDQFTIVFYAQWRDLFMWDCCFLGKIDKFLEKVTQTHGNNKYALVYRAAVEVAKLQIELTERK